MSDAKCINDTAKSNLGIQSNEYIEWDQNHPRWRRILENKDSRIIWKAIGWKGEVTEETTEGPNDSQFKAHFEELLNPVVRENNYYFSVEGAPYIPVLDDPFTERELDDVIRGIKTNKSYVGICPILFSVLPPDWKLLFLAVFNVIFRNVYYPFSWCHNKFVTIVWKLSCGNYRGISIMNRLAKIYDMLINNRLLRWYSIDKCQAGAQKKRGLCGTNFVITSTY